MIPKVGAPSNSGLGSLKERLRADAAEDLEEFNLLWYNGSSGSRERAKYTLDCFLINNRDGYANDRIDFFFSLDGPANCSRVLMKFRRV